MTLQLKNVLWWAHGKASQELGAITHSTLPGVKALDLKGCYLDCRMVVSSHFIGVVVFERGGLRSAVQLIIFE